jgi:hypothetical protein
MPAECGGDLTRPSSRALFVDFVMTLLYAAIAGVPL